MARHFVQFDNVIENPIRLGNSMNWKYTFDGKTAKFYRGNHLRLETEVVKNTLYVFDVYSELLAKVRVPKDPIKREFWEYGLFNIHMLDIKPCSAYNILDNGGFLDTYMWKEDAEDPFSACKKTTKWISFIADQFRALYRDFVKDGSLLICAAFSERGTFFWYDKERTTLEDVKEFFKGIEDVPGYRVIRGGWHK